MSLIVVHVIQSPADTLLKEVVICGNNITHFQGDPFHFLINYQESLNVGNLIARWKVKLKILDIKFKFMLL